MPGGGGGGEDGAGDGGLGEGGGGEGEGGGGDGGLGGDAGEGSPYGLHMKLWAPWFAGGSRGVFEV